MSTVEILAMRDSGRSWTEVAERTGLSVAEAKALVADAKAARREALSRTYVNENARGLLEYCASCKHARKFHDGDDYAGGCTTCGPERVAYEVWDEKSLEFRIFDDRPETRGYPVDLGCNEFLSQSSPRFVDWLFSGDVRRATRRVKIDPPARIHSHSTRVTPELPQTARLATKLRRYTRKQKRGKTA